MAYLTLVQRLQQGLPLTPEEKRKATSRVANQERLAENRQAIANVRENKIAQMRTIVEGLPTPPNGLNGQPLIKWELSQNLPPLQGDELGPAELIAEGLARLAASAHKGVPIPESEWAPKTPRKRGKSVDEMLTELTEDQWEAIASQVIQPKPPTTPERGDSPEDIWQAILDEECVDNSMPMETIGNPLDADEGDDDYQDYDNWN